MIKTLLQATSDEMGEILHNAREAQLTGDITYEKFTEIRQSCFDRIISLWMPKTTSPDGMTMINVKESQVFLKVNKQRGSLPAGRVWEEAIDFENQIYTLAGGGAVIRVTRDTLRISPRIKVIQEYP